MKRFLLNNFIKGGRKAALWQGLRKAQDGLRKKNTTLKKLTSELYKTGPLFGFSTMTRGGIKYHVPKLLREEKSKQQAIRWFTKQVSSQKKDKFGEAFLHALLEVSDRKGGVIKKRDETHKQALLNQKFLKFFRRKVVVSSSRKA